MKKTILVVDFDMGVRSVLRKVLGLLGYHVLMASSFREGLNAYSSRHDDIDAILMDLGPSSSAAIGLLSDLRAINPEIRIIAMTDGTTPDEILEEPQNVMRKPFPLIELKQILQQCLDEQ